MTEPYGEEMPLPDSVGKRRKLVGAPGSGARAFLARRILSGQPPAGIEAPKGPLVLVLADSDAVEDVADAVKALAPLFGDHAETVATFGDDARERLASLELARGGARLVLATLLIRSRVLSRRP